MPKMISGQKTKLLIVLLLAAWLRFDAVTQDIRFHPDEALFATFSRTAAVHGEWMFPGALDKTPLSLYASALSMHLTGIYVNQKNVLDLDLKQGEFAARLPNVFAGLVLVALVYALAGGGQAGLFAALLAGLSPFLVAYNATAFTDGLMLTFMLASVVAAQRQRWGWSGALLALSFASKQQGVFYLPLLGMMWWLNLPFNSFPIETVDGERDFPKRQVKRLRIYKIPDAPPPSTGEAGRGFDLVRFLIPFLFGVGLVFLWDAARGQTSLFALAAVNNNPERVFVRFDELLPRLSTWLQLTATIFGAWWLTGGLVIVGSISYFFPPHPLPSPGFAWGKGLWKRDFPQTSPSLSTGRGIFILYISAYLLIHWIFAFNTYDRYLLPLIPLIAVLVGHGLAKFCGRFSGLRMLVLGGVMLLMSQSGFPGDNRARHASIIQLAEQLNVKPLGAIIYDHWLGWEMGYYIGAWSDKRRVYYPDAQTQADDALLNPDPAPRYIIAPEGVDVETWITALRENGFMATGIDAPPHYIVYEIIPSWAGDESAESASPGRESASGE